MTQNGSNQPPRSNAGPTAVRAIIGEPFNPSHKVCGFYPPDVVSRQRDLTDGQKRLYERALRWAWQNGRFWRGFESMADALGKSARQVKDDMATLEAKGLMRHTRRRRNSNVYSFLWHAMFEVQPTALQEDVLEVQDSPLEVQDGVVLKVQPTALESSPLESCPLNYVKADNKLIPGDASQKQRTAASSCVTAANESPKNNKDRKADQMAPLSSSLGPLEASNPAKEWTRRELADVRRRIVGFWGREPEEDFEVSVMLRAGGASAAAVCELLDRKYANTNCRVGGRWAPRSQDWFLTIIENEFAPGHLPEPPAPPHRGSNVLLDSRVRLQGAGARAQRHLRLKAARKLGSWTGGDTTGIPTILCDEWTDAQVKAFRLLVNRSATWAAFDEELLALELQQLSESDYDLSLTGFDPGEIDGLLAIPDEERANAAPPLPVTPVSRLGDLWLCGIGRNQHRILCSDATSSEAVSRLLGDRKPILMVCDPPYGIELDSEWRDRAGLNGCGPAEASYMKHRTEGHTETTISGDTRADWSEAFELVPSLQIAYVWHASKFTREVLDGLLRIGFVHHQQIIWDKGRTVLTRTLYWFQHEPAWFVRKVNAPWYGKAGENSTIWASPSPKFIMGGSDEQKFDHPTQKPVELMRRPILNHLKRGELVYDPFLGSGTTLAAAELTERVCLGLELDAKYIDVAVFRWQMLASMKATLDGDGRTFEEVAEERRKGAA